MEKVSDYEAVFERNPERYFRLHETAENKGMKVAIGARVKATAWAVQNNVLEEGTVGTKTGKGRDNGNIMVQIDGNKTKSSYWAGFWEQK